jgi:hypothetical protein
MTLVFSTWSGRTAFTRILSPYLARGGRQFPICSLGSKPKTNDAHGNFAPVLTPVDWVSCGDFPDLAPLEPLLASHPAKPIANVNPRQPAAALVDDDVFDDPRDIR